MKIILFAHQNWGIRTIETILKTSHEILQVFTHPMDMDPHEKVWYGSVKTKCLEQDLNVEERKNLIENDVELIKRLRPDLILSVGWRKLIPKSVLDMPKYGSINLHDGLIPKYRGFAPINWAIINDEKEVGLTLHYIDETADTGDILLQRKIPIDPEDTATTVYNKLLDLTPKMISDILSQIESNSIKPQPQKKLEGFFCARRFPEDGKIDWTDDRETIYNLIRALSDPYPNAYCYLDGQKIYIKKAKLSASDYRGKPGRICSINEEGVVVTCGSNHKENQALLITEIGIDKKLYKPNEFFKKLWLQLT
jgi:methionyl-tRNA formyltransferase